MSLTYDIKKASALQIQEHLQKCSAHFIPALDTTLDIEKYAAKIYRHAVSFEAWEAGVLVGLVAAYLNDTAHFNGFITNVSVLPEKAGQGIAKKLLDKTCSFAIAGGFKKMQLEVHRNNTNAIRLYHKSGFDQMEEKGEQLVLTKNLENNKK